MSRLAGFLTRRSALILFLVALAVRLVHIARSPHRDELFHVMAALSLLADGDLSVDGGSPYTRAWPFTYLVAGLFRLFGDSLVVARLPGVVAGAGLVAVLFLWVRKNAGDRAAWVSALLLCFDPSHVFLSQLGRFYAPHALFFFVGAIAVYYAVEQPWNIRRLLRGGILSVVSFGLAYSLHVGTFLGLAAILSWLAFAGGPSLVRRLPKARRWLLVPVAALAMVAAFLGLEAAFGLDISQTYTWADDWASRRSGNPFFYHQRLAYDYPTLWSLFPIAVLIALTKAPRVTLFSTVMFLAGVGLASFGGMKHQRYILYLMPFFFTISGIAVVTVLPWLRRSLGDLLRGWSFLSARPKATAALANLMLIGTLLLAIGTNRAPINTVRMLSARESDVGTYGWQPDWNAAMPLLASLADSSEVVLGSWPLAPRYFLGRLDVSLHAPELTDRQGRRHPEFFRPRWFLPQPVVSEPESLARIMACKPSGLLIVENGHWRASWAVSDDLSDYIVEHLDRVEVPGRWGLWVYRWQSQPHDKVDGVGPDAAAWQEDCADIVD